MTPEFWNAASIVFPAVLIGTIIGLVPSMALTRWLDRRERRRWQVQQQLRDMEQATREEGLPDDERERCGGTGSGRLGLPEEERHR